MDPYAILGLNPSATHDDIKAAWRRLARIHHPDRKGGSQAMMSQINTAYNLLMDTEARARFDQGHGEARPPIDVLARQAIMQIVFAGLTQDQTVYGIQNLHDYITHNLRNNLDRFKGERQKIENGLAKCARQRKEMLFKTPGNPIEMVFEQVESSYKENLEKLTTDVQVMIRAQELYAEMVVLDSSVQAFRELADQAAKGIKKGGKNPLLRGPNFDGI